MPSRYLKLLGFVLRTRVSRVMLIIVLLVLAYGIASGSFLYSSHAALSSQALRGEKTIAVIYSAVLTFLLSFQGGLSVLKSDRDYLFTLPLNRSQLALALYIGQLVVSGALTVVWLGWVLPLIGLPPTYAVAGGTLFAIYLTSLSISVAELQLRQRALAVAALVIWTLSPLFGIPVAPSAMFYGYATPGLATLLVITVALTAVTVSRLSRAPVLYGYAASPSGFGGRETVTRSLSFAGTSPLRAIYKAKLMAISTIASFGGVGGGRRYYTGRISLTMLLVIVSAVASAYVAAGAFLIGSGYLRPLDLNKLVQGSNSTGFIYLYFPVMVVGVLAISFTASWIMLERPWLAFTSMRPGRYLRHAAMASAISSLAISAPFAVAMYVMWLLKLRPALSYVPALLLAVPSLSTLMSLMYAYLVITPQARHEGVVPGQVRARALLISVVAMAYIVLILLLSTSGPLTALEASAALFLVILLPLGLLDAPWDAAARRMVEEGYV